jgi:nitroreductase
MHTFQDLIEARYGTKEAGRIEVGNDTIATMLAHRSVRAYANRPLPEGTLMTLITAAQSAPSSSNLQAWSVVAVEETERKSRLSALAGGQKHIAQCPLFLVWLADLARLERAAQKRGLSHEGLDYTELFVVAVIDAALAAQNALVAAESLGLGTVYIGAIRNKPLDVATELALPARVFPLFGLCVGFADPARATAEIKPRLPQAAVLHRERYAPPQTVDAAVQNYDDIMMAFYEDQKMKSVGAWSEHSAHRIAGPHSLTGRHVLRDALLAQGFPLR